jgi:hypothetical protein
MYIYSRGTDYKRQTAKVEVTAAELRDLADNGQISVLVGGSDLPSYLR